MELFGRILLLLTLSPFFEISEYVRCEVKYNIKRILNIVYQDGRSSHYNEEVSDSVQSNEQESCGVAEVDSCRSSVDGYEQIESSSVSDYEQSDERKCHSE